MDLLDFSDCKLYFEEPLPSEAEQLINSAARQYGDPEAEMSLLKAHLVAPENLAVLVGLYRYYFYQHRLEDALKVAERAMQLSGRHLGLKGDWNDLDETRLAGAAANSFGLLRFYLLALKAASIVLLRLGKIAASKARLRKLAALDSKDLLGAAKLLEVVDEFEGSNSESATHPESNLVPA